ncbi:flagellar basal body P-ring formation chaperone FlgA [bacterium]|nr:flagellar basal body P-ring formation chaperone FlgA [bacterium]
MRTKDNNILMMLACIMVFSLAVGTVHATVIPAEKVRVAVIEQVEKLAVESGLEILATVPQMGDIDVRDVENPVMTVSVPGGRKIDARVPVRVEFSDDRGHVVKRVQLTAKVQIFKMVAVVRSDMSRGQQIAPGDMELARVDVAGLDGYFEDTAPLEGMLTNRILRAGSVLTKQQVREVPVILRGDKVVIKAVAGNVIAYSEGVARQDGGIGEKIRVYHEMTKAQLDCVVLDNKTVQAGK